MKFDQDFCLNLFYELNPRVRCAFGNVFSIYRISSWEGFEEKKYSDFHKVLFCSEL